MKEGVGGCWFFLKNVVWVVVVLAILFSAVDAIRGVFFSNSSGVGVLITVGVIVLIALLAYLPKTLENIKEGKREKDSSEEELKKMSIWNLLTVISNKRTRTFFRFFVFSNSKGYAFFFSKSTTFDYISDLRGKSL